MPANRAVSVPQFRRPVVLVPEASGNRAVPGAVAEAAPPAHSPDPHERPGPVATGTTAGRSAAAARASLEWKMRLGSPGDSESIVIR